LFWWNCVISIQSVVIFWNRDINVCRINLKYIVFKEKDRKHVDKVLKEIICFCNADVCLYLRLIYLVWVVTNNNKTQANALCQSEKKYSYQSSPPNTIIIWLQTHFSITAHRSARNLSIAISPLGLCSVWSESYSAREYFTRNPSLVFRELQVFRHN
jgi:hypothetical protein